MTLLAAMLFLVAAADVAARRIVSIGGDITEIVFALGAGAQVVAVDGGSTYPAEAQALPRLGYFRRLSAEGILALQPDLVLASGAAGPAIVLQQVAAAGIDVRVLPDRRDPQGMIEKIHAVGEVLGLPARASELADDCRLRLERILAVTRQRTHSAPVPRVLFVLALRDGTPIAAGAGTAADTLIELAGGRNAASGFEGYRPMSREALMASQPDMLLMTSGHADAAGGVEQVLARPELAASPAARDGRALTLDAMLLLGFGPRTPLAVQQLARALHPGLEAQQP